MRPDINGFYYIQQRIHAAANINFRTALRVAFTCCSVCMERYTGEGEWQTSSVPDSVGSLPSFVLDRDPDPGDEMRIFCDEAHMDAAIGRRGGKTFSFRSDVDDRQIEITC
mmetsp:Transcript_2970/g.4828  ORF Transcript_2970/g.4828 Transcript_2970/m.4828 type:complete len:111 (-) Transcript_2970:964-1296(-)